MSGIRWITLLICASFAVSVWGQTDQTQDNKPVDSTQAEKKENPVEKKAEARPASESPVPLFKNLLQDQKDIWTSPFRMKPADLEWAVPFAGITTGLIMTDRTASHETTRWSHANASKTFSDAGLAFAVLRPLDSICSGLLMEYSQKHDLGILSGEAMVSALAI